MRLAGGSRSRREARGCRPARVRQRGHHGRMSHLPARTGADVHLADAFAQAGLPAVPRAGADRGGVPRVDPRRERQRRSVSPGARRGTWVLRGRIAGPCWRRTSGGRGTLGAAILLRATLVARLRDLEATGAAGGWTRSAERRRPPGRRHVRRAGGSRSRTRGSWRGWCDSRRIRPGPRPSATAPLCLEHLVALMDRRTVPAWWPAIESRQLGRLRDLRDRLERFAHASAHDRRHLQTDDQRASVEEVADLLGGPR